LLKIHSSGLYYVLVPESEGNLHLMLLIDEQLTISDYTMPLISE